MKVQLDARRLTDAMALLNLHARADMRRARASRASTSAFAVSKRDRIELSDLGRQRASRLGQSALQPSGLQQSEAHRSVVESEQGERNEAQQRAIRALERRDAQVRAHERAHLTAAGDLARGGARFEFERGPNGQLYAVGGEVSIDTRPVPDDPEATLRKAQRIQRAANAPVDPSAQDRAVAREAAAMARQAEAEIRARRAPDAGARGAGYASETEGVETDATETAHPEHAEEGSMHRALELRAFEAYAEASAPATRSLNLTV